MKKDILFPPVEGVFIAVAKINIEGDQSIWNVYLINENEYVIHDITIRSKGYGQREGKQQLTSTLRHHLKELGPKTNIIIEPIEPEVFHLNNEYWISYYVGKQIFDKKFIFVPESIIDNNVIFIPQLELYGILHS